MAYVAWSRFSGKRNEFGQTTEWIEPGESVTQAKLDVTDADWDYLLESGAVRESPYPKGLANQQAPAEALRERARAVFSGELTDEKDIAELRLSLGLVDPATEAATAGKKPTEEPMTTVESKKAG